MIVISPHAGQLKGNPFGRLPNGGSAHADPIQGLPSDASSIHPEVIIKSTSSHKGGISLYLAFVLLMRLGAGDMLQDLLAH
jgi:hypothetical protein